MKRNESKTVKLNSQKRKFKRTFIRNQFLRIVSLLLILSSMLIGSYFLLSNYYENKSFDADTGGYYSALVSVNDVSSNSQQNPDGQPNGDSSKAAKSLETRLNPLGVNSISVEKVGSNFLKVTAPKSSYSNETLFKNAIERAGSVYFISTDGKVNTKYDDLLVKNSSKTPPTYSSLKADDSDINFTRDPMSNYIKGAKSTAISITTGRLPVIEYELNSTNLVTYLNSLSGGGTTPKPNLTQNNNECTKLYAGDDSGGGSSGSKDFTGGAAILVDADSMYNLVRNYYQAASNKLSTKDKVDQYYKYFITPLRQTMQKKRSSGTTADKLIADIIYDMFYCSYTTKDNPKHVFYDSLMDDSNADISSAGNFYQNGIYNTLKFLDSTSNYVYDSNATTKDFQTGGTYAATHLFDSSSSEGKKSDKNYGNTHDIFSSINPVICDLILGYKGTGSSLIDGNVLNSLMNYFVFDGTLNTSSTQTAQVGQSFVLNGQYLVTFVNSYSLAKLGSSLFNASSAGFRYEVSSLYEFGPKVSPNYLEVFYIFMGILVIALLTYLVLVYRLLGAVAIVAMVLISVLIFSVGVWFSIPTGIGTIITLFIIIGLNTELYAQFFENIKENVFTKKRSINSSYNISIKEFLPTIIDAILAILIPLVCMLWISSSNLKLLTISLSLSLLFSLFMFLIISILLFKILCKTRWFESYPFLFPTAKVTNSTDNFYIYYLIKTKRDRINYLLNKNKIDSVAVEKKYDNLVFSVNETISYYKEQEGKNNAQTKISILNKDIDKLEASRKKTLDRINSRTKDYNSEIKKLETHVDKLLIKLEKKETKLVKTDIKEERKFIKRLNKRILMLEKREAYYDETYEVAKLSKIRFKIEKTKIILETRNDFLNEYLKNEEDLSKNAPKIINTVLDEYLSRTEDDFYDSEVVQIEDRFKTNSKLNQIKIGKRLVSIGAVLIVLISAFMGFVIGPHYDYSFANRVDYTFWGDTVEDAYESMESLDKDSSIGDFSSQLKQDLKSDIADYEKARTQKTNLVITKDELNKKQAQVVGNFLTEILANNIYANWFLHNAIQSSSIGDIAIINDVYSTYGTNFKLPTSSSNENTESYQWVTISVQLSKSSESYFIKQILANTFKINFQATTVSDSGGAIAKKTSPSSAIEQVKQYIYAFILGMVLLLFYYLLRYKWTYFMAMLFSIFVIIGLTFSTIIAFYVPFGINTLITSIFVFAYAMLSLTTTFLYAKRNITVRDEEKLTELFKNEIENILTIKKENKKRSDKNYEFRREMNDKIKVLLKKDPSVTKDEYKKYWTEITGEEKYNVRKQIFELKQEYRQFKKLNRVEYNNAKILNKKEIIKEKQTNQYIQKIKSSVYQLSLRRMILITIFYLLISIGVLVAFNQILTIGFTILIGVLISNLVILYLTIPLLVWLEGFRIRQKIANKKHINSIYVTGEEQIIAGINN
ncbi:protein translocase SecDF, variant type [Spiroplasma endosymbiont of Aspidapion aeneum]|uniref:protein translocase SecDF, variant type n=1 Tax=Spiroplasma endosymbiont of Aspidapion aeneum TaxID=3066276 RepID=UPI00313ED04F